MKGWRKETAGAMTAVDDVTGLELDPKLVVKARAVEV